MLSRIADSLFWLHRYMERADGMLRLLKTSYILSFDKVQASGITWEPALQIFTTLSQEEINVVVRAIGSALLVAAIFVGRGSAEDHYDAAERRGGFSPR